MSAAEASRSPMSFAKAREPFGRRLARLAARTIRTRTAPSRPHPPLVSFTFDDIPASAAERGAALLEEAGARGTFYLAGSLIDAAEAQRHFATREQCRDLHRRGHEIGCHTYAHRPVSALGRAQLADDLAANAAFLAQLDPDLAPTSFAYPFNTTSLRAKRQLETRFAGCRGGVPGINAGRIDLGFLRAVELADHCIDAEGVSAWIARAVETRGWLVFFSHGIGESPEPWGCHPDLLRTAVSEARAQGAAIVTMREALRRVLAADPAEAS